MLLLIISRKPGTGPATLRKQVAKPVPVSILAWRFGANCNASSLQFLRVECPSPEPCAVWKQIVSNTRPHNQPCGESPATPLVELLLELENSVEDARIWCETESGKGEVLVHAGSITQCRIAAAKGRTALLRILSASEITFGIDYRPIHADPPLVPNVAKLLALHELRQTRWHELCAKAPSLNSVLRLTGDGTRVRDASRGIKRVLLALTDGRRSLMQVLEESSFDPVDSLEVVIEAVEHGLISSVIQPRSLFPLDFTASRSGSASGFRSRAFADELESKAHDRGASGAPSTRNALTEAGSGVGGYRTATDGVQDTARRASTLVPCPIIGVDAATTVATQSPPTQAPSIPSAKPTLIQSFTAETHPKSKAQPAAYARDVNGSANAVPAVQEVGRAVEARTEPPPPIAPLNDRRRIDHYDVLLRMGVDELGTVYLCRQSDPELGLRQLFTVRLFNIDIGRNVRLIEEFIDAARVASGLQHANVLAVCDAGVHEQQPYVVLEYVEGCSLKQLLKHTPKNSPYYTLPIIMDALKALHAVHSHKEQSSTDPNYVPCDVSPDSMIVGVDGTCRLCDLSTLRRVLRPLGVSPGAQGYFSPEQVCARATDRRSDIFSLGVVLWNMLTGGDLISAPDPEQIIDRICNQTIVAPSQLGAETTPQMDNIVLRALSRNPDERFESAAQLLSALRAEAAAIAGLATTVAIAAWVRSEVGPDLAQRRLAILDATRRPSLVPPKERDSLPSKLPTSITHFAQFDESVDRRNTRATAGWRIRPVYLLCLAVAALVAAVLISKVMTPDSTKSSTRGATSPSSLQTGEPPEQRVRRFEIGR